MMTSMFIFFVGNVRLRFFHPTELISSVNCNDAIKQEAVEIRLYLLVTLGSDHILIRSLERFSKRDTCID